MILPFEPGVSQQTKIVYETLDTGSARTGNSRRTPKIFCALLALACPFAAAFATVPLIVMGIYLLIARRMGAFEAL